MGRGEWPVSTVGHMVQMEAEIDVLVPHEAGIAALADVPGVRAVLYGPAADLPPEADTAQVLVAPFLATGEIVSKLGSLPKLRLVQLLTAGAEAWIGKLPEGVALSVLVNAARWPVAHTDAIVAELTSGRLRAALDVTDPEPQPRGHPLWAAPGLLLTAHVGGSVPQAMARAFRVAAEQIAEFASGNTPPNLVLDGY